MLGTWLGVEKLPRDRLLQALGLVLLLAGDQAGAGRMRIVILAGGEGRRIGGGKPLRMLGGRDPARPRPRPRAELVGRGAGRGARERRYRDDPAIEGPLGGVAAALALGGDVLTIPCDMPFLPDDLPARLVSGKAATLAASGGQLHPVCALWKAEAAAGLPAYLATGRRSLQRLRRGGGL